MFLKVLSNSTIFYVSIKIEPIFITLPQSWHWIIQAIMALLLCWSPTLIRTSIRFFLFSLQSILLQAILIILYPMLQLSILLLYLRPSHQISTHHAECQHPSQIIQLEKPELTDETLFKFNLNCCTTISIFISFGIFKAH